jgi:NAD(P)-dependent dehydrogenase (short-subunit alcohol dehydrogenase family)
MFDLTNKVAIVTGARRGMGKAHAAALVAQGAIVISTDIVADGDVIALDVSKKTEIDSVFSDVEKKFGRLDILVNNAGVYQSKPALDITEAEWDRVVDIDLKGSFLCTQAAAKIMKKNNWGRIINIASISSGGVGIGVPGSVHYTAAKGGVIGMTEALAVDLAPYGILVNAIAPGGIDTPMANPAGLPKEEINKLMGRALLKRIGRPEEVASAVVFLASDEASYITGTTLYVDGGWLAA